MMGCKMKHDSQALLAGVVDAHAVMSRARCMHACRDWDEHRPTQTELHWWHIVVDVRMNKDAGGRMLREDVCCARARSPNFTTHNSSPNASTGHTLSTFNTVEATSPITS